MGGMGSSHARRMTDGLVPGCELTAVADVDPNLQARFPDLRCFADAGDLFRSGEVDAVLIATPHYSHTTLGSEALAAGLHVLVEKPISVHKADCEKLLAAPRRPDQVFGAMFNMRTRPVYAKIKELITSGELGELRRINWIITDWFRTHAYYASGGWRGTWEGEGGGVLLNQCPHQLDMWQWLFGMPKLVHAVISLGRYHPIEVEDDVTATMEYADGTTGVFITSTGEMPGTNRLEIVGERGRLVHDKDAGGLEFLRNEVPMSEFSRTTELRMGAPEPWRVSIPIPGENAQQHVALLRNFVDAILHGKPLLAPAEEGIHSVELGNAILLAGLKRERVELPMDGAEFERTLRDLIRDSSGKPAASA